MYMYIHGCVCAYMCVSAHAYVYGTTFSCIRHSVAYIPATFTPQEIFAVLISVRG